MNNPFEGISQDSLTDVEVTGYRILHEGKAHTTNWDIVNKRFEIALSRFGENCVQFVVFSLGSFSTAFAAGASWEIYEGRPAYAVISVLGAAVMGYGTKELYPAIETQVESTEKLRAELRTLQTPLELP